MIEITPDRETGDGPPQPPAGLLSEAHEAQWRADGSAKARAHVRRDDHDRSDESIAGLCEPAVGQSTLNLIQLRRPPGHPASLPHRRAFED